MTNEDERHDDNIGRKDKYRELNEDQRKTLELFWQEPSVIVAIASALVVVAYYYITDAMCVASLQYQALRTVLVMFGTFMAWTSTLTAIKHRFFRTVWLGELENMESEAKLKPTPMYTKVATHPRGKTYFWERWSAEKTLILSLLFLTLAFALFSIANMWNTLAHLPWPQL